MSIDFSKQCVVAFATLAMGWTSSCVANGFSSAGPLTTPRALHTATLLPTDKVLVAGGDGPGFADLANAEIYNPASDKWSAAGSLATARSLHTATLLPSGKTLVAGGFLGGTGVLSSAELYDPASNIWSVANSMATRRGYHTATILTSGRVLVVGGLTGQLILPALSNMTRAATVGVPPHRCRSRDSTTQQRCFRQARFWWQAEMAWGSMV